MDDNQRLDELELMVRAIFVLRRANIHTVGEVRALGEKGVRKLAGMGPKVALHLGESIGGWPAKNTSESQNKAIIAALTAQLDDARRTIADLKRDLQGLIDRLPR